MAKLTGLQIQKLLPKTNCKECGSNTCLAFAMKLAAQKAELSECPYASDEAKQILGAASEPPVRKIQIGTAKPFMLGDETVLYRHEKTFVNQTALAINLNDGDDASANTKTLQAIKDYKLERVGEILTIDSVCITCTSGKAEKFAALAKEAVEITGLPLIINSTDVSLLTAAANAVKGTRSLLASATPETADALVKLAQANEMVLAVTAPDLNALTELTAKIKESGFNDLVLEFQTHSLSEQVQTNSIARRAALKGNFKPLGYPTLAKVAPTGLLEDLVSAITEICKYGGICVLPSFDASQLVTLMSLRQNIYTDPQKPIQVEPKLYEIGEPTKDSPVFVTTNFSLTYFIVSGEIENSGLNAWLVIPECEGMSVLTAWAAGKFSGAAIAKFCKEIKLNEAVNTRKIVIPGYVAQISGELEESMPGWKVVVGPQEASDMESWVKANF
ncbi:MAG: acetyl-CoA decarbonylase/synthase complex subunit gamma [Fibrobacteres bacterium]|nr:acetyl-CoA decarbonylase/synthase complex subunit gamma [Fibrobacterota bacterium]